MMNTKMILAFAIGAAALAAPAIAQNKPDAFQQLAAGFAAAPLKDMGKAWPAAYQVASVNAKADPWKPVSAQQMAQATGNTRKAYQTAVAVDYNGDGVPDRAYIANNSKQGAVIVELGGGKGTVVAYKVDQQLLGGQELAAAGKRRLVVNFPESSVMLLTSEGGKPAVYYLGD